MVNLVWVAMAVIGIVYAMINGTMEEVNKAVFDGAKDAVTICIGLISVLVFWLGLMKIAEEAGLLKKISFTFYADSKKVVSRNTKGSSVHGIYSIKYDGKLFLV